MLRRSIVFLLWVSSFGSEWVIWVSFGIHADRSASEVSDSLIPAGGTSAQKELGMSPGSSVKTVPQSRVDVEVAGN